MGTLPITLYRDKWWLCASCTMTSGLRVCKRGGLVVGVLRRLLPICVKRHVILSALAMSCHAKSPQQCHRYATTVGAWTRQHHSMCLEACPLLAIPMRVLLQVVKCHVHAGCISCKGQNSVQRSMLKLIDERACSSRCDSLDAGMMFLDPKANCSNPELGHGLPPRSN